MNPPTSIAIYAAAALLPGLYCLPASAQANPGGKKIEGQVVVFDANAKIRAYQSPPHDLSAGKPVTLVVKNINTFREKYTTKLGTEDRHNLTVPGALGGLILTKPPTFGGVTENFADTKNIKSGLPAELQAPYQELLNAIQVFNEEYETLNVDSDRILTALKKVNGTNFTIRKEVIGLIGAGTRTLGVDKERDALSGLVEKEIGDEEEDDFSQFSAQAESIDKVALAINECSIAALKKKQDDVKASGKKYAEASKTYQDGLIGVEKAVEKAAADASTKRTALAEMQAKYDLKKTKTEEDEERITAARLAVTEANALLARLNENNKVIDYVKSVEFPINQAVNGVDAAFKSFSGNRPFLKDLYVMFLNPERVPTRLIRRMETIRADVVTPSVQIEPALAPIPLSAEKASGDQAKAQTIGDVTFNIDPKTVDLPVYGRMVLDFSAGAAWTNLEQKTYFISPNAGNSALKGIREGIRDRGNVGPAVLAHLYPTTRFPLGLTGGLCLGVAATDPARYLAGFSVVTHLSRVRLMYSFGIAYGKQNTLNGDILNGDLLDPAVAPLGNSPSAASVYRRGRFNALTLSFSF